MTCRCGGAATIIGPIHCELPSPASERSRSREVAEAPDNSAAVDPGEVAAADVSTEGKSSERPSRPKRSGAKKAAAVSAKAPKAHSDRAKPSSKQDKIVA